MPPNACFNFALSNPIVTYLWHSCGRWMHSLTLCDAHHGLYYWLIHREYTRSTLAVLPESADSQRRGDATVCVAHTMCTSVDLV